MTNNIFYITNDPERAIGLEKVLDNFHIVCIDNNDIVTELLKRGMNVFSLENSLSQKNVIFRNSNRLLENPETQKYIKENSKNRNFLITFKISPAFEKSAQDLGYKILNTSSQLNRKFENKISQFHFLQEIGVSLPKSFVCKLNNSTFIEMSKELGNPFVIQFDRGHTGSGTIFLKSEDQFNELVRLFPNREVKFSEYIKGQAWTLNAVTTRLGVFYGGLSYQITGVKSLTDAEGATVGNDWTKTQKLTTDEIAQIKKMTEAVGKALYNQGFQGLFGLDIIFSNHKAYLIEINARQPASTSMHTKLMLENNEVPLLLLHVAEFISKNKNRFVEQINKTLSKNYTIKSLKDELYKQNNSLGSGYNASQFVIRNQNKSTISFNKMEKSGVYSLAGEYLRSGYCVEDLKSDNEYLLLTTSCDRNISAGSEIARIQTKSSCLNENNELKIEFEAITKKIKSLEYQIKND